jgi:RNA-directed DNA polymerase
MERNHPEVQICRFADDGLAHCKSKAEAEKLLLSLKKRFGECGLQIHPDKTRIVYCKDDDRRSKEGSENKFTFLGYEFRPRLAKNKYGKFFVSFLPAISPSAEKVIRGRMRAWKLHCWVDKRIEDLSKILRPYIQGWMNYFMKFYPSRMYGVFKYLNKKLIKWATRKYKGLKRHRRRAQTFLARIAKKNPWLFPHWKFVPITIE